MSPEWDSIIDDLETLIEDAPDQHRECLLRSLQAYRAKYPRSLARMRPQALSLFRAMESGASYPDIDPEQEA